MKEQTGQIEPQGCRYPMVRSGGLFLVCIGLGMVAGTLLGGNSLVNEPVFFLGVGVGIATLFAARYVSFGRGTRKQLLALFGAIALEFILLTASARLLGPMDRQSVWYRTMLIVGIHFLPMAITFGPRMLVLGLACITIALLALVVPSAPFVLIGVVDGALKASIGGWMLTTKYPRRALNTTSP